jgi:sugar/nucleoside kinase (ribokinase family)
MPSKSRRVLVVGDAFCDVNAGPLPQLPRWGCNTISPEPILAQAGGAALNVACGLSRLGVATSLYTGLGKDAFGDLLRGHCARLGVDLMEATVTDQAQPTGVCMVLSGPDDRAFCSQYACHPARLLHPWHTFRYALS